MSDCQQLTQELLDKIQDKISPQSYGYLKRFKNEIELKIIKDNAVLKLPINPNSIYELKFLNELETAIKTALELKNISTSLKISKDYFSVQGYQQFTATTAIYPKHSAMNYLTLGLASEAGEVAGVMKKWIRGDYSTAEMQSKLVKELGDVLWYIARIADEQNIPLANIFKGNKEKLLARQQEGVLKGDGDDR